MFPFGWLDFGALVRPKENGCSFSLTFARDDKMKKGEARPISIWAGSAGAIRIFWNGKEVISDDKYRALDAERLAANVTMKAGENRLLVKACGDDDAPMISIRLAGADGSPDARIATHSDLQRANEAFAASAVPWKPPAIFAGIPMRSRACSITTVACERDTFGARLNESVAAGVSDW